MDSMAAMFGDYIGYHSEVKLMPMKNPHHPGLSIRHDCLEPLDLSVTHVVAQLGVGRKQLSDVLDSN